MDSAAVARALAEESIVLLKNENSLLPLAPGTKVSIFGRTQEDTIFSGNGSGAAHADGGISILTACEKAGLIPEPGLAAYYRAQVAAGVGCQPEIDWSKAGECVNSGLMYEIFGQYRAPAQEYCLTEDQLNRASAYTDTAILVLGRNSGGEECDRHLYDDYYLTEPERKLVEDVCGRFPKVILVLNLIGLMDLSWLENRKQIRSVLFIGIPGEQGMAALANILTGKVNPSGKLAFTVAKRYEDYPSSDHFSWDKDGAILTYRSYGLDAGENGSTGFDISPVTVYHEDIYAGYRYFDTFGVEPLFPFGFGLSYTSFVEKMVNVRQDGLGVTLDIQVENTGTFPGKEVVQIYLSGNTEQPRPAKILVGFEKTELLPSGGQQTVSLRIPWKELSSYCEKDAAYLIGAGAYTLLAGTSSRQLSSVVEITVPRDILVSQCANRLVLQPCNREKLSFLTAPDSVKIPKTAPWQITLEAVNEKKRTHSLPDSFLTVETLTDLELASLCVGYGPGIPFSAFRKERLPNTAQKPDGAPATVNSHPVGVNGYVSPAIPEKGIFSVFYKDGPAGIGVTAWPTEMLIACCFNRQLWYDFGNAVGSECERQKVDVWLAPAVNLHRHPLGGRSFEYFSEDPFLTGTAAVWLTKGVQENHRVLACPKHFAANEQETFRRGNAKRNIDAVDSILSERALRELYLKPFQMLVEEGNIHCTMTSFNKINGTFAGGSKDLCTHILREEWGFDGVVVTDWGDMDTVVDGADAVAAGNDVVMPGGPPVIRQILTGLEKGTVTRQDLLKAARHLVGMTTYTSAQK